MKLRSLLVILLAGCDDGEPAVSPPCLDAERLTAYPDLDGDGYGRAAGAHAFCPQDVPDGWVDDASDCDDARATVHPGAPSVCDGLDNDCDGIPEDDDPDEPRVTRFRDADGDGFGDDDEALLACPRDGWVGVGGDCDDADPATWPGADDECGGGDADCDGWDDACPVDGERSLATVDATLLGQSPGDAAGSALLAADVDGDGVGDLLVAAPGVGTTGAAYLALGPFAGERELRDAALVVTGDGSGAPLEALALGDLDGDGLAELVVGAPGRGAWVFGAARRGALTVGDADVALARTGDEVGAALAAGADLDGDALGDVIVGAPSAGDEAGRVEVYDGDGELLTTLDGTAGARLGAALATGADLDGDGLADLVVGAPGAGAGAVHLYAGPVLGGGAADAVVVGEAEGDGAGAVVTIVGDIDGDGLPDVMVGAPGFDGAAGADAGAAYLVRGGAWPASLADARCRYEGVAAGDGSGAAIGALGDIDGSGRADVLIGAPGADRAWLALGPFAGTILLSYAEGALVEAVPGDSVGAAAGGVDLYGDERSDLAVGAPGADAGGSGAGAVHVMRGWEP